MRIDELSTFDLEEFTDRLGTFHDYCSRLLADRDDDDSGADPREHEHGNPVGLGDEIAVTPWMEVDIVGMP
jgi:hypothetical protein